jgi:glycosyltransferase involved in cell wall biosynthesis
MTSNPEKYRKMGMNGRKMIEAQFSRTILAEKFTTLLKNIRRRDG